MASLVSQTEKKLPAMWETWVQFLDWEDPLEGAWQPTPVFLPGESPWRGAWQATVHGVAKNWTQLSTHACTHTHLYITDSAQESVEQTIASHLSAMNSTKIFQ